MANLTTILTPEQRANLAKSLQLLEEAKEMILAMQACEIDCSDYGSVRDMLERKARLLIQHFTPPK